MCKKTYNSRIPTRTFYDSQKLIVYGNQILVIPTKLVTVSEGISYVAVHNMLIGKIVYAMKKLASKYKLQFVSLSKTSELNTFIRLKNDAGVCFLVEFRCLDKHFIISVYPVAPRHFHTVDITMYIDRSTGMDSLVKLIFSAVVMVTPQASYSAAYAKYYAECYKVLGFRKP